MSRRLILKNASGGGEFEPYVVSTTFEWSNPGTWYLTPLDTSEGTTSWPIRLIYKMPNDNHILSKNVAGNMGNERLIRITFSKHGDIEVFSPAINQWYGEVKAEASGVEWCKISAGWSDDTAKRYRVDIDESRWGVLE